MNHLANLLGRIGLSLIFIISGWAKIGGYAGTQQYMEAMGVPGALLPLVILLEVGGGLAVLAGLFTRWVSLAFVLFSLATGFIFHASPDDQVNLMKNIAIAGGFLVLAGHGAGTYSLDALIGRRRTPAGG
ncbi:DoxX family protein [Arenimonas fontis]|nr:DoxX family protein [Arenimonas fontis]